MAATVETIEKVRELSEYKHGFVTEIDEERAPKGLNEDIVRFISAKKEEPEWLLEWRLKAFRHWRDRLLPAAEPDWARVSFPPIDFQDSYYFSAPKRKELNSLDEVDPELLATYAKLGIPLKEQEVLAGVKNIAIDAVFDSVSVATTFKKKLQEMGIIFGSFS
ncbi:MAG: Fe-S cluster assembly protein SufB, partial [Rhodospirillaceae bacterium]|nr:Fe-S cluster assembly protein SufB [Rhodospirillaceae bacterium]